MPAPRREEIEPAVVWGEFSSTLADGRVRCELCPRACTLRDGQRGFCFVRQARAGRMTLSSYGRSTGFCIDPIEKKPLYHFYPGSAVLSFGTAGCNLGCQYCQNWDISRARQVERMSSQASPEEIAVAAVESGSTSVAFTYNDPVVFFEYAVDAAAACHERGVKTVAVTAGYLAAAARPGFFAEMDAANIDLKAFTERFYRKLCLGHLQPVLETLAYVKRETKVWLEITTLLIPGENDSEEEVGKLCAWMVENLGVDTPLHFSAFHPDYQLLDRPATSPAVLRRARRQALAAGLAYVYTGNIADPQGQSTYCSSCGGMLIERDGYELGRFAIRAGRCAACGAAVAGHFAEQPGSFGARRLPLAMGR